MTFKEIQDIIKMVNRYGLKKVSIQNKDFKINVEGHSDNPQIIATAATTGIQQQPVIQQVANPALAEAPKQSTDTTSSSNDEEAENNNLIEFKSPMIGTFYRRPTPDKEPYLKIGDIVEPGKVVCIIEAMKLFNDIECDISGKVVKILVEDASPIEYDQPLFVVDPNA